MHELDGFVPTTYHIEIDVEDGIYRAKARVGKARTWCVTYKVQDNPVDVLIFDKVVGNVYDKDGKVRALIRGRKATSVRQGHAYPNLLLIEFYSNETLRGKICIKKGKRG